MALERSGRTARRRWITALSAYALVLQSLLFGVAGPSVAVGHAGLTDLLLADHGSICHAGTTGAPEAPAPDPAADALCKLVCALRSIASPPAVLPAVAAVPAPSWSPDPSAAPAAPFVAPAGSPLPVGARGPPA
ncbi:hypothetical protein [Azospirillum sp. ST 5-10]|uniref:hypothetical protein n=1 Tax=unclassified Azospirillum TaxID=2630922 RepID=UPI003F4A51AF